MTHAISAETATDGAGATTRAVATSTSSGAAAVRPAVRCSRCGQRYNPASRYGDAYCSNECIVDFWAETGAYPNVIPAGSVRPKRVLSECQLAARRASIAKATAA